MAISTLLSAGVKEQDIPGKLNELWKTFKLINPPESSLQTFQQYLGRFFATKEGTFPEHAKWTTSEVGDGKYAAAQEAMRTQLYHAVAANLHNIVMANMKVRLWVS